MKILSTNQPAGTLSAVNGIRFVSMTWVILGHVYAFGLQSGGMSSSFNSSYELIYPYKLSGLFVRQRQTVQTQIRRHRMRHMTQQFGASDQGLRFLLTKCSFKF